MTKAGTTGIQGVHHTAYRCRDSEETRAFYEDFLGLPLAITLEIGETKTGRDCLYLHTFYELDDGTYLGFFEAPSMPYEFHDWHDFDLHIALEVSRDKMMAMKKKGEALGMEVRGVADHDFIHSIYFRDPNGYVVELTCRTETHDVRADPTKNRARELLEKWQAAKATAAEQTVE